MISDLVEINGTKIFYELLNKNDNCDNCTVFIHGGPGDNYASFFSEMVEEINSCMLYYDARGCGRSEKLSKKSLEQISLSVLVEDLKALLEHLNIDQVNLIGHGFGSLTALEFARIYPNNTNKVIVINPWIHFPQLAFELLNTAAEMAEVEVIDPTEENNPNIVNIGSERARRAFNIVNTRDLLNYMQWKDDVSRMHMEFVESEHQLLTNAEVAQAFAIAGLWEFEYPIFLQEIEAEIFIIAGKYDKTSYPEQCNWILDLADAEMFVLESGHYPWIDNFEFTEILNEILDNK